ncbi:MAG: hypothetical protein IT381_05610, partial [Deltaproteobacteria bacterium]|nr:hypothetical protein [Deltaproteobacteria bacterium]
MIELLVSPARGLTDATDRRKARFLAGTLAAVLPIGAVSTAVRFAIDPDYAEAGRLAALGIGALAITYALARTRHYVLAGWLTSFMAVAVASIV